jgi:hypothetical protein
VLDKAVSPQAVVVDLDSWMARVSHWYMFSNIEWVVVCNGCLRESLDAIERMSVPSTNGSEGIGLTPTT